MSEILTVSECKDRLRYKISERALRRQLRAFGRVIVHRNQITMRADLWPSFLEFLECSNSQSAKGRPIGRSSGRALTPELACERARALIAKTKPKTF